MIESIAALQRVMTRLDADMLALKEALSPQARFAMFKGLEEMQSPTELLQQMTPKP